jgi:ABC-type multidrug transport system fused ATPase/permease subunit
VTAGVVVLLVGLLATVWLTDWSLAVKVLFSTPLLAFAVAFAGQFVRTYTAGRRDPRA